MQRHGQDLVDVYSLPTRTLRNLLAATEPIRDDQVIRRTLVRASVETRWCWLICQLTCSRAGSKAVDGTVGNSATSLP